MAVGEEVTPEQATALRELALHPGWLLVQEEGERMVVAAHRIMSARGVDHDARAEAAAEYRAVRALLDYPGRMLGGTTTDTDVRGAFDE